MAEDNLSKIKRVACSAQLACVLEASAEKPGNVTPTHDYKDTSYQDFLAGSIALGPSIEEAALRGYLAGLKEINPPGICVGELILKGVKDVCRSHPGGNTHLGAMMLMVPVAAGAGMCLAEENGFKGLRPAVIKVLKSSTVKDSRDLYTAISLCKAGGLGRLVRTQIPLLALMGVSAERDRISEELFSGLPIIWKQGLPFFEACMRKDPTSSQSSHPSSMRAAILGTYLYLLSEYPDTLIAKKKGLKAAVDVSNKAKDILAGRMTPEGFDAFLRSEDNGLNPGTTADLVAAISFLYLLKKDVF